MSILKNTGGVVLARIGLGAAALTTDVVISRALGPALKGEYYNLVVFSAVLAACVAAGQDFALNEHGSRSHDGRARNRLLSSSLILVSVVWIVAGNLVIGDHLPTTLGRLLDSDLFPNLVGWASVWAGAEAVFVISGMLIVTSGFPVRFALFRVVRRSIVLVGAVLVVWLHEPGRDAVRSMLFVQILAVTSVAALMLRGLKYRLEPPTLFRTMVRAGVSSLPARLAERLQNRVAVLLVAGLAGAEEVGLFSVSLGLAELLFYLTGSLGSVLFSLRLDDPETLFRPVRLATPLLLMGALICGSVGALLVPVVYGKAFAGAALPLVVLLPGVACLGLVQTLSPFLVQRGCQLTISIGQVVGLSVLVVGTILFAREGGALGAAVGVSIGYATTLAVCLPVAAREAGRRTRDLLWPTHEDVILVRDALSARIAS